MRKTRSRRQCKSCPTGRTSPPARWPGPDSGNLNADCQLSPTQPVARRSEAAPTVSAQLVQVKLPPPHASNSTVAQVHLQPNSPPHNFVSRLLFTCAWTQKDHTYHCVKPLVSQDFLSCFVRVTWMVRPRVRTGCKRSRVVSPGAVSL